jgi:hypothetical protein
MVGGTELPDVYCEEFGMEYVLDVGQCISVVVFELDVSYHCCYGI